MAGMFDTLRAKYKGYSDDEILGALQATKYPDYSIDEIRKATGYEVPKRSLFAVANDMVIEGANAIAGAAGSAANMLAPGNRFSQAVDEFVQSGEESQSDAAKLSKRRFRENVANADGVMGELGAVGRYVTDAPLLALSQAAGSFALPGFAVKGAQALGGGTAIRAAVAAKKAGAADEVAIAAGQKVLERAGLAGGATAGGLMSGGDAAGTAYELVIRAGGTEEEAQAAAREASLLPAAIGAAGGLVGAERILAGAGGVPRGSLMSRALNTGLIEGGQEAVEEGVTQYEGQRVAVPFDPSIDPGKGVAAAAGMGFALGAPVGAATGAIDAYRNPSPLPKPPAPPRDNGAEAARKLAAADNVGDMAAAATELAMAPLTPQRAADPNAVEFEADPRYANAPVFRNGQAPRHPTFGSKQAADLYIGEQELLGQFDSARMQDGTWAVLQTPQAANANAQKAIEAWMGRATPMPEDRALAIVKQAADERGMRMTALPMPDGVGWTVVKSEWLTPEVQAAYTEQALAAAEVERNRQARIDQIAEGPSRAPRQRLADPVQIDPGAPNAVAQYVDRMRQTNTPAARAFVQDFNAGRITPDDVLGLLTPRSEPTPNDRIAAAAAQAQPIQPGDLLTKDGMPYGTMSAATIRARKEGGEVVEVQGGWAVRKETTDVADPGRDGIARPPDAIRGDRDPELRQQRPADVAVDAAAPDEQGVVGVAPDAVRPGERASPDDALTTLKARWADAVQAGDTEGAARINEQIVAAKAGQQVAAPAPVQADAPAEVADWKQRITNMMSRHVFRETVPESVQNDGQRVLDAAQAGDADTLGKIVSKYTQEAGRNQGGGGAVPGKVKQARRGVEDVFNAAVIALQSISSKRDVNAAPPAAEPLKARVERARKRPAQPEPAAAQAEQAAAPKPKRPPRSFRKKVKVTTEAFVEDSGKFEQRETDADSALTALDEDIAELEAFRRCVTGS